eukprot:12893461-Prorocentrum_lima.AAC.1
MSVTYGGKTPAEMALGRRPPDILQWESMSPGQLIVDILKEDKTQQRVPELAQKAHLETQRRDYLRKDLASRFLHGPFEKNQSV